MWAPFNGSYCTHMVLKMSHKCIFLQIHSGNNASSTSMQGYRICWSRMKRMKRMKTSLRQFRQERNPGVASHAPGSVGECEGMNLHTPKAIRTLGVGVLVDSRIFRKQLQGPKLIGLRRSLYHWKALGT